MSDFFLPPEWILQERVWLSWPHNLETWTKRVLLEVESEYSLFVKELSEVVSVHICVLHEDHEVYVKDVLKKYIDHLDEIFFHQIKTNDAWIRDHGPDFVFCKSKSSKIILNWGYNSWGGKYPPFEYDNQVPLEIAKKSSLATVSLDMILEGGSFEVNGKGDLLTTKSCLLNKNRNPDLSQLDIEENLKHYFGVKNVIWLDEGIAGDDTDGHIDDFARFIDDKTIVYSGTEEKSHQDYESLKKVEETLKNVLLLNGSRPTLIKLPVPIKLEYQGEVLPCSYANFLITNEKVLVPVFNCKQDQIALDTLQAAFLDRKVIGIPSNNIIIGLGSLHCLSKHEFDESHYIKS